MISEHFEVAATDFPDEHCYAVYIYIKMENFIFLQFIIIKQKALVFKPELLF